MRQVNLCSRTQPLKTAQIDLRTLDGSHCAEPGGTLIGHVNKGRDTFRGPTPPAPNVSVTFRNLDGAFTAQSDGDGIYELQHLAPGTYTVDSRFSQNQYASSGTVSVTEGTCREAPALLWNYDFSGLVLPDLKDYVTVKLVRTSVQPEETGSIPVEPDGRFYFRNVPDGEYLLAVSGWVPGATGDFYYPRTYDRRKAARIRVVNHTLAKAGEELDFNPKTFPLIPVLVTMDPPGNSTRFSWEVQFINSNYVNVSSRWSSDTVVRAYAARGASYKVQLYGSSYRRTEYNDCVSDPIQLTVHPGMDVVHLKVPASCQ